MKQTDKNIKEIRIYHSLWKNILLTVGCFAFAVGGYFILHDANTSWPTKVFGGIGSMVFFGCGGMLMFMMTLYKITTHIPFFLTSSLKKHTFYNLLINNILYLCVT